MNELIQETSKRLRLQGGRMTPQRRLILQTLETLTSHPTAEELYHLAHQQDPTLNLSTVYRTLRWLEQEDLVSTRVFHEERRQERFDPAYPSEHHHFLCTGCKAVIEFDTHLDGADQGAIRRRYGRIGADRHDCAVRAVSAMSAAGAGPT